MSSQKSNSLQINPAIPLLSNFVYIFGSDREGVNPNIQTGAGGVGGGPWCSKSA
jgi:hypothetical protein